MNTWYGDRRGFVRRLVAGLPSGSHHQPLQVGRQAVEPAFAQHRNAADMGLAGLGQEFDACLVGLLLLGALVRQQRVHQDGLWGREGGHAKLASIVACGASRRRTRDGRPKAGQHVDDGRGLDSRQLFAHAREMSAGEVTGFVSEHANEFVRGLGLHQGPDIHENPATVGHERVE